MAWVLHTFNLIAVLLAHLPSAETPLPGPRESSRAPFGNYRLCFPRPPCTPLLPATAPGVRLLACAPNLPHAFTAHSGIYTAALSSVAGLIMYVLNSIFLSQCLVAFLLQRAIAVIISWPPS